MTANPRLAKAHTGVSLSAKAHTGVSPQRRKGRQGEQPGEENGSMEVKDGSILVPTLGEKPFFAARRSLGGVTRS